MAPLEGFTLGQRQKYYNHLVREAIATKTGELPKINFEEDDVDNMMKIDLASYERNVDYILDVYKCDDMLYVSRAINKSTWLITEPQYAYICNPTYLHSQVFPQMNAKAVTKLMLHIRRHLKDDVRVKAFYKYVYERNPKAALHWLENCSVEFIETVVTARADDIPMKLLKRLCRKSINILRLFVRSQRQFYDLYEEVFKQTKCFLKNRTTLEEFLDIMESFHKHSCSYIYFNDKYTNLLMKTCPKRIKDNFQKFYSYIDLPTFVKYIETDEIRSFLMANSSFSNWKTFTTLTPFLIKLPREEMLDFLSTLYGVDYGTSFDSNAKANIDVEAFFYAIEGGKCKDFSHIYRWYQFMPFDLAFCDIRKLISVEPSPEKRHSMLVVLLTCASYDFNHVKTVLQYYHDKHINEPYLHKKTFVDSLLTQHDAFRFDDSTWDLLNALFHSLEVYIDSKNKVQECLNSIIVHNALRDLPIHEVVEEKFEIKSLKDIKKKLSSLEQDKLFDYLYNLSVAKLNKLSTNSETGMHEAIKLLKSIWAFLKDWNRVETHHRFVIDKIAEFGEIHKSSSWIQEIENVRRKRRKRRDWKLSWRHFCPKPEPYINLPSIYNIVKSYRKQLFEVSLVLHASEEVLLNALKHDPGLLARCPSETNSLRCNDEVSLNRFLSKLRIYWSDSLAIEWNETNIKYLQKHKGHRALVRGILTLLPHNKILEFIKIYAPNENKIHWSEVNEIELSMQKLIANNMHLARPQLSAEVVLWYAKGDYLQFALLSLNTMFYNLRSSDVRKHINIVLSAPVSLQKHGIRLAFNKLNTNEVIDISSKIWKNTKNPSIRATLFKCMFDLLCKEKKIASIKSVWVILSSFIDDLNEKENVNIYHTLEKVRVVPLSIAGDFFQKAYLFLKSFPTNPELYQIMNRVIDNAEDLIEHLDSDFVENSLLEFICDTIETCDLLYLKILSAYLLCSKDLRIQMQKYNNLLHPVIEKCVLKWANGEKYLLDRIQAILKYICHRIPDFVFVRKMIMPVEILTNIQNALFEGSLCIKEHYILLRRWQLTVRYLEVIVDMVKESDELDNWESIRKASAKHLASISFDFVVADEEQFYPSIYLLFKEVLQIHFEKFKFKNSDILLVLENMLDWEDNPSMYLLILELIPKHNWSDELEESIKKRIYFHPSQEVTMHYFRKFSDRYTDDDDDDDDEDDDTEDSPEITESEQEDSQDDENIAHYERDLTDDATPKNYPTLFGNLCIVM